MQIQDASVSQSSGCSADVFDVDWADGRSRPLSERSLCPWTVGIVFRRGWFPRRMAEAQCSCSDRCRLEGTTHQCREIFHPMIVLQKTGDCDERNVAVYEPARHLVTVGCTCVDASIQ